MKKIARVFLLAAALIYSEAVAQKSNLTVFDATASSLNTSFVELERWNYFPSLLEGNAEWPAGSSVVSVTEESRKIGYGTFALVVLIDPALKNSPLTIEAPSLFSNYDLFVNGKRIGSKGKVGIDAQTSEPDIKPEFYSFVPTTDSILLVVHASNFYPNRGGVKGPFRLGTAALMEQRSEIISILDYTLLVVLLVIGIVSLCLYYVRFEHQRVFLFLSLFVMAWFMRSLFGYYYRIMDWVNVPWALLMRLEYLSLMFTTVFAMHFIASLFPHDFQKWVKRTTDVIVSLFSISIVALPAEIVVPAISIYLGFSTVVLSYILFVIIKAFVDDRGGATIMLVTMFAGSLTFGYVIVCFLGYFETNMFIYNIGFIILAILLVISVSVRLSRIDRLSETSVLTMEHFFGDNSPK
ncbi:MAG: hypothetical protein JSS79_13875 [Bacteroidetes bacterium]|nr:hypothetical protein [Bacteroidota bacterium]